MLFPYPRGPFESRSKKNFAVTHLSCLQRLVSALVITVTSQPVVWCLVSCPAFCEGFQVLGLLLWSPYYIQDQTTTTKQQTQPSRKERAGEMEPENISWPSHFLVLWLCRLIHMLISKGLKVVIMSPTSQDYGDLFIRRYMSKRRAHSRHSGMVKIENLKRKLLNRWWLKDTLTCFRYGGRSLQWPPASWPVGPANTPLPSQDLHRSLSKLSILPGEACAYQKSIVLIPKHVYARVLIKANTNFN